MTNYELISLNESLLRTIVMNKVHVDDVRYTSLYKDYLRMRENGDKMTYIVAVLAKRYRIGRAQGVHLVPSFLASLRHDGSVFYAIFH